MAKPGKTSRVGQVRQAYAITKRADPRIGLILAGAFLLGSALGYLVFWLLPPSWLIFDILSGVLVGVLVALIVFGRRASASQIKQMEGQPGAAVAVLSMLKRGWRTDQVVAFNRQQDVVHRLVGPPGIVLIGEGSPSRLKPLLSSERVKHQRVVSETPIHEIIVGNDDGQVPLRKLTRHVTKLPRQVKPAQMTGILSRLRALDAHRSAVPMPKGPVPTSMKGMRGQMRGR